MAKLGNSENNQKGKWGGPRPGSGRPQHSKNPDTITREEALRQFRQRVSRNTHKLFNAQLDLAIGEKYLMVIETIGKGSRSRRETHIVTSPELIKDYLDDRLDNTETEYYFMTTKPANNQALDSLLNRTYGTPKQDNESPEELSVKFEVINRVPEPKDK